MAVLCICDAFRLWVAAFISDKIQLVCKRFRNVLLLSVHFFWFFPFQSIQWVTSSQHFKNEAYIQACLAFIYCFQLKKATCRQRFKNEAQLAVQFISNAFSVGCSLYFRQNLTRAWALFSNSRKTAYKTHLKISVTLGRSHQIIIVIHKVKRHACS